MIKSKNEYRNYIETDRKALFVKRSRPKFFGDEIWKFQILLRKCEYVLNCRRGVIWKLYGMILKYKLHNMGIKLGFTIPINVFGPGLSIAHYGTIAVNGYARIGRNCRIHEGVTIGSTGGNDKAPIIGDNVFIASGAKIIGDITIADGVAIGANSVVVKSILEKNITVAGVPAKKISDKNSACFIYRDENYTV